MPPAAPTPAKRQGGASAMTYAKILEEMKERRVKEMFQYELCTPKIAKEFLEKLSKVEGDDGDASSEEAKEVLKFQEQFKVASEAEEGDWTEPVDSGLMEIFEYFDQWEGKLNEKEEFRDEIDEIQKKVEEELGSIPQMSKFVADVTEKCKSYMVRAEAAAKEKEQSDTLRDVDFMMPLVDGIIATYGMLGFTVPHFIIQGSVPVMEQLEARLVRWQVGLDVDPESELGKKIKAGIEKLKGVMPQCELICKEHPQFSLDDSRERQPTINLKATFFAGVACAIKLNKDDLIKMIEKAEAALKEDGEDTLFGTEEKQKILNKAQVDKALEVLKAKQKDLEKAEAEKTEKAETVEKPKAEVAEEAPKEAEKPKDEA